MKIIKKLCIPLLSLVLVLSCFSVSQMDASAAMSANDRKGPGYNQGGVDHLFPGGVAYPAEEVNVSCGAYVSVPGGVDGICCCSVYRDDTPIYPDVGRPYGTSGHCRDCGHHYDQHFGGSYVPSHTHNYSTTWGAWRKISSCRLPG